MTETLQHTETKIEQVECYLCSQKVPLSKSMKVPLTTGGDVYVHPSCMEFYLARTTNSGSACGGCTGDAGCC